MLKKLSEEKNIVALGIVLFFANYFILELLGTIIGISFIFLINLVIGTWLLKVKKKYMDHFIITVISTSIYIFGAVYTMIFKNIGDIRDEVMLIFLVSSVGLNLPCVVKNYNVGSNSNFLRYFRLTSLYFGCSYCLLMIDLLFISGRYYSSEQRVNMVPFKTIKLFLYSVLRHGNRVGIINLFGNILLFVPIGFIISIYTRNKLNNIFILVMIPVSIEIIQFLTGSGVTDIDDIILNVLGELIGLFVLVLIEFSYGKRHKVNGYHMFHK